MNDNKILTIFLVQIFGQKPFPRGSNAQSQDGMGKRPTISQYGMNGCQIPSAGVTGVIMTFF